MYVPCCRRRGFTAFDIATQSLVASYMGRQDRRQAKEVLMRVLQLGVSVGSVLAVVMVAGAPWAPAAFTGDARIIDMAQRVFPLLGVILVWAHMTSSSSLINSLTHVPHLPVECHRLTSLTIQAAHNTELRDGCQRMSQ